MELDPKDVVFESYSNASSILSMTARHLSTGMVVRGYGVFYTRLREELLEKLAKAVEDSARNPDGKLS